MKRLGLLILILGKHLCKIVLNIKEMSWPKNQIMPTLLENFILIFVIYGQRDQKRTTLVKVALVLHELLKILIGLLILAKFN